MIITEKISLEMIITLSAVVILLFVFIIYAIISNYFNRKEMFAEKGDLRKQEYLLIFDIKEERVKLYKNFGKELLFSYLITEAYSLIDAQAVNRFNDWYSHVIKSEITNEITMKTTDPLNSTLRFMRLSLLFFNKDKGLIYAKLVEVKNNPPKMVNEKGLKILDFTTFNEIIRKNTEDILGIRGLLIILKIEGLTTLKRRYGLELSNLFLMEVWKRINKLSGHHIFVTYLNSFQFAIFKMGISDAKQAISYLEETIRNISSEVITLDKYTVSPSFKAGMTLFGEYTYDLKTAINNASQALEKPNHRGNHFKFGLYDYSFEKENQIFAEESEQIAKIINNSDVGVTFSPFVYLLQSSLYGYFINPHRSMINGKDFQTNFTIATNIGMKIEFLKMAYTAILSKCISNSRKRYRFYLAMDITHLPLLNNIFSENEQFAKLRLHLVFDYQQLLNTKDDFYEENIKKLQDKNVKFSTFSDVSMLTITSNRLQLMETIVFTKDMITGIEIDDLKYMTIVHIIDNMNDINMKYMAYGVVKYEQAELLQKAGINVISGDFITAPLISVDDTEFLKNRRIQSLHKE